MVCDNGDRVRHSLNMLSPFSEGKDDCEKFVIIDVIVVFGGDLHRKDSMQSQTYI